MSWSAKALLLFSHFSLATRSSITHIQTVLQDPIITPAPLSHTWQKRELSGTNVVVGEAGTDPAAEPIGIRKGTDGTFYDYNCSPPFGKFSSFNNITVTVATFGACTDNDGLYLTDIENNPWHGPTDCIGSTALRLWGGATSNCGAASPLCRTGSLIDFPPAPPGYQDVGFPPTTTTVITCIPSSFISGNGDFTMYRQIQFVVTTGTVSTFPNGAFARWYSVVTTTPSTTSTTSTRSSSSTTSISSTRGFPTATTPNPQSTSSPTAAADSASGLSSADKISLGVGLGVGLPTVLITLGAWLCPCKPHRRSKGRQRQQQQHPPQDTVTSPSLGYSHTTPSLYG